MKLKLEKQKVITLSSKEMSKINGGGKERSIRLNGGCSYSRNHPANSTSCDGDVYTVGCNPN